MFPAARMTDELVSLATMQLTSPEVLHGLGLIADREIAPFALELATGERSTHDALTGRLGDFSTWRLAVGEKPPLYLQRLNEAVVGRVSS